MLTIFKELKADVEKIAAQIEAAIMRLEGKVEEQPTAAAVEAAAEVVEAVAEPAVVSTAPVQEAQPAATVAPEEPAKA